MRLLRLTALGPNFFFGSVSSIYDEELNLRLKLIYWRFKALMFSQWETIMFFLEFNWKLLSDSLELTLWTISHSNLYKILVKNEIQLKVKFN